MRRSMALSCLVAFGFALGVAACSSSEEAACDAPPAPGTALGPRQMWSNSQYMNATYANAIYQNAGWANHFYNNAMNANQVRMNGISLNGVSNGGVVVAGLARLDRTHLVLANGEELRAGGRVDVVFSDGARFGLDVAAREDDPKDPGIVRYTLTYQGKNVCEGDNQGIFVPGTWDATGARHESADLVTFACFPGAIAKCVNWGYRPWQEGIDTHQACTRMVRADYCGDGASHTRNGTPIDVFDDLGVNAPERADLGFEAAWGPDGATCVGHTRYLDYQNGQLREPSCWAQKPKCSTWSDAKTMGGKLGNASAGTPRQICGS